MPCGRNVSYDGLFEHKLVFSSKSLPKIKDVHFVTVTERLVCARVNWTAINLLVKDKIDKAFLFQYHSVFLWYYSKINGEGHFMLVMWMYDVFPQVCLAIAHYSHPADPQLLFGFEYVGKRYHGSMGMKTHVWLWPQMICTVSTRAAKQSWAVHTSSLPASHNMRRLSRECKVLMLWIAGPKLTFIWLLLLGCIVTCIFKKWQNVTWSWSEENVTPPTSCKLPALQCKISWSEEDCSVLH